MEKIGREGTAHIAAALSSFNVRKKIGFDLLANRYRDTERNSKIPDHILIVRVQQKYLHKSTASWRERSFFRSQIPASSAGRLPPGCEGKECLQIRGVEVAVLGRIPPLLERPRRRLFLLRRRRARKHRRYPALHSLRRLPSFHLPLLLPLHLSLPQLLQDRTQKRESLKRGVGVRRSVEIYCTGGWPSQDREATWWKPAGGFCRVAIRLAAFWRTREIFRAPKFS